MRLKLTVEYDGTGFRGWARQPGARTVEGELRHALAAALRPRRGARGRGSHRHGRARARERRLGRGRGRPAAGAGCRGAERGCCRTTSAVARGGAARRTRSTRASTRARARTATASGGGASGRRSRRGARSGIRGRSTSRRSTANAAGARRRARLPGVHADARRSTSVRAHRPGGAVGRARRGRRRVRDHRRLVPAPHGADARRHDARGPRPRAAARRPARAARAARRPRRTASI